MKCRDCKNCIGYQSGYFICETYEGIEFVPSYDANNEDVRCDLYADLRDGNAGEGDQ